MQKNDQILFIKLSLNKTWSALFDFYQIILSWFLKAQPGSPTGDVPIDVFGNIFANFVFLVFFFKY